MIDNYRVHSQQEPRQESIEVFVEIRLATDSDNGVKARAEVTIALGSEGLIKLDGYCVIKTKSGWWVAPPSRKGDHKFFPTVVLSGRIRSRVEKAILSEFERSTGM